MSSYFVGLDLAQSADFTALAVLERHTMTPVGTPLSRPLYRVRHLMRFPLHTPYPLIVSQVGQLLAMPERPGSNVQPLKGCTLGIDATGVGKPVCDMFRAARLPCRLAAVTITGGQNVHQEGDSYSVPKKDLVSVLEVLIQSKRLKWDKGTTEGQLLLDEAAKFRAKVNIATGNESFESWRARDHDDLVLAVAIAAWLAERTQPPSGSRPFAGGGMPPVMPGTLGQGNGFRL